MTCLIIGDSIAANIADYVKGAFVSTYIGGTAEYIEARTKEWRGDVAVISVGSLDRSVSRVVLAKLRAKLIVKEAVWILPFAAWNGRVVMLYAIDRKDKAVSFASSLDGIHPTNYASLVESINRRLKGQ
jgi:hypothetical protein